MKRRGLLLDRDGVINVDRGYIGTADRFEFLPGIIPFLREAQLKNYALAVVTNQSGVARGLFTEAQYDSLTDHMKKLLADQGVTLDLVLACFMHPEASIPSYRGESPRRKPNPGMLFEAAETLNLDLSASLMMGDSQRDMQAGLAAGVGTCLWLKDNAQPMAGVQIVTTFAEASRYLLD